MKIRCNQVAFSRRYIGKDGNTRKDGKVSRDAVGYHDIDCHNDIKNKDIKNDDSVMQTSCLYTYSLYKLVSVLLVIMISMMSMHQASAAELSDLFGDGVTTSAKSDFLKVNQAFKVIPIQKNDKLTLSFEITPEYYVYKDKISLKLPKGVVASPFKFSQSSKFIDDPNFGKVAIFDQNLVTATTVLTNKTSAAITKNITLKWQGCAKAGLCYPPQKQTVAISLPVAQASIKTDAGNTDTGSQNHTPNQTLPKQDTSKQDTPKKAEQHKNNTPNKATDKSSIDKAHDNNKATAELAKTAENKQADSTASAKTTASLTGADAVASTLQHSTSEQPKTSIVTDAMLTDTTLNHDNVDGVANVMADSAANGEHLADTTASVDDIAQDTIDTDASATQRDVTNLAAQTKDVVNQDPFGLSTHPWLALGLLFLAGLGLAFTPCVLPMLPIVSNIIARQHSPTAKQGLLLSGGYAVGVAVAYGILGAVIAIFGQSLGIIGWLQNPVILIGFAVVFVVLALYMLDAFALSLPNRLKQKMQSVSQAGDRYLGSVLGSFIAGFLSALVVSPCVSAPLFGALLAVSTIGNPVLGFAALFMLGFGLSAPLMLLGISQGNLMPKAGEWMNWVKQGFALLLFAVALLLLDRVFVSPAMLVLWSGWFMTVALWAWYWVGRGQLLTKPMAIILALWAALTLVGAAAGSRDVWQPLAIFQQLNNQQANVQQVDNTLANTTPSDMTLNSNSGITKDVNTQLQKGADVQMSSAITLTSIDDLMPVITKHQKVLVDVTAEWCIECRIMEKTLFATPPQSLQTWQIVKLDVTKTNADSERVLAELRLFGPPAMLYFVNGKLKIQQVGEVKRDEFEQTLDKLNKEV